MNEQDKIEKYGDAALARELQAFASCGQSSRNKTLNEVAFKIGRLVGGGYSNYETVFNALLQAGIAAGLSGMESRATIKSGLTKGIQSPRKPDSGNTKYKPTTNPTPQEVITRPPLSEVQALWDSSQRLSTPSRVDSYLDKRGLDSIDVDYLDCARALPITGNYYNWWPSAWAGKWALVVRAFEADGKLGSLHARAITELSEGEPKTRWPVGFSAKQLLFADERGQALLRGQFIEWLHGVMIVEGFMDFIKASIWSAVEEALKNRCIAVFGIVAGSAPAFKKITWPDRELEFFISTDHDVAGDDYAKKIRAEIPVKFKTYRVEL